MKPTKSGLADTVRLIDMAPRHIEHILRMESDDGEITGMTKKDLMRCIREEQQTIARCIQVTTTSVPWICGYCVLEIKSSEMMVQYLFISKAIRRNGIGSAVMAKIKSAYHPGKTILVPAMDFQLREHLFLRSQGFKAVEVIRGYGNSGDDCYVFQFPP